jgi:hypothetical protein
LAVRRAFACGLQSQIVRRARALPVLNPFPDLSGAQAFYESTEFVVRFE